MQALRLHWIRTWRRTENLDSNSADIKDVLQHRNYKNNPLTLKRVWPLCSTGNDLSLQCFPQEIGLEVWGVQKCFMHMTLRVSVWCCKMSIPISKTKRMNCRSCCRTGVTKVFETESYIRGTEGHKSYLFDTDLSYSNKLTNMWIFDCLINVRDSLIIIYHSQLLLISD